LITLKFLKIHAPVFFKKLYAILHRFTFSILLKSNILSKICLSIGNKKQKISVRWLDLCESKKTMVLANECLLATPLIRGEQTFVTRGVPKIELYELDNVWGSLNSSSFFNNTELHVVREIESGRECCLVVAVRTQAEISPPQRPYIYATFCSKNTVILLYFCIDSALQQSGCIVLAWIAWVMVVLKNKSP
jgi:hypothetical protein